MKLTNVPPRETGSEGGGSDGDSSGGPLPSRTESRNDGGDGSIDSVGNSISGASKFRGIPFSETQYYLTVSSEGGDGDGGVGEGTQYNYNSYNTDDGAANDFGDIGESNVIGGASGNNRTLSEILSLVENGAASVYRDSSSITSNRDGDSSSISSLGEQLGVDRLVNIRDHNNIVDGVIPDYNYNGNEHILFDNGIGFLHANATFTDLDSFSQQLFNQIEFKMGDDLTRYVCPAIIVLGNISNFVAFLVLRRKKFRKSSVAFYMRAYALANLCFLDLMLGIAWLCLILEIQYLAHRTDWSCRLWTFISNVITYSGIWFVVVMSIDRFVFSNLPNKASGYCSVFTAKGITTFVIICLIVVSIHAMWTFELQPQGCWVSHQQDDLHKLTWPWWSAALYSYIPLLLLLVQIIAQSVSYCVRVFLKQPHSPPNARQGGDQDTFVKPVFVITVAFFLFTIPSTAINLLDIHIPTNLLQVDVIAKIELTKKITELLSSFNNSLLGIVLLALSPSYQTELLGLCRTIFCCARSRTLKVFEMRAISQSDDSSPNTQADYELCNNNEDNLATDV